MKSSEFGRNIGGCHKFTSVIAIKEISNPRKCEIMSVNFPRNLHKFIVFLNDLYVCLLLLLCCKFFLDEVAFPSSLSIVHNLFIHR